MPIDTIIAGSSAAMKRSVNTPAWVCPISPTSTAAQR
jgi:hypothetical protein